MESILFALWFFLPAGLANGAPVIANKVPFLNKFTAPMDFKKNYRGKRIFGDNKTWRGFLAGIFTAIVTVWLQQIAYQNFGWAASWSGPINYSSTSVFALGFLLGAGALLGDALESFIKRQLEIPSGESWFPFDQLDYVIGGIVFASFLVQLAILYYLLILIVWFALHIINAYLFYLLGFKDKPI